MERRDPRSADDTQAGAGAATGAAAVDARLRALVDAIPDLMFRITADGTYLDFAGDVALLANPREDVVGGRMDELLPPEVAGPLLTTIHRALESRRLETVDYVLRTMGGDEREFETRVVPIDDNEVVTIVRDATELRQTERELRAANERLVQARDAERRRLERNLHDGAQQRLIVALQALRVAIARLPDGGGSERDLLLRAEEQLAWAIGDIREFARGLHPPVLTESGLAPALGQLAARLDGILPVELDVPATRFDAELEACAYYLVAEALSNAAKYAGATSTQVRVVNAVEAITVDVVDDGCGGACASAGGGLEGLAERVSALGGSLSIESPSGGGTRLHAELPVPLHLS
jgi:PAS domain S-box-containing protein